MCTVFYFNFICHFHTKPERESHKLWMFDMMINNVLLFVKMLLIAEEVMAYVRQGGEEKKSFLSRFSAKTVCLLIDEQPGFLDS